MRKISWHNRKTKKTKIKMGGTKPGVGHGRPVVNKVKKKINKK